MPYTLPNIMSETMSEWVGGGSLFSSRGDALSLLYLRWDF